MKVDGIFGEITERELKKIQEKLNFEQTGVLSEDLNKKMLSLLDQIQFKNNEKTALKKQQKKVVSKTNSTSSLEGELEDQPCDEPEEESKTPITTIPEADHEEQGSSGTNPLSKNQEYEADLDQTQISMNSKEDTTTKQVQKPEEKK